MGNIELFNSSILSNEVIASRYKPLMNKLQGKTRVLRNSDERFFFVSEMTPQVKMDFLCSCIKIKDIFLFELELH